MFLNFVLKYATRKECAVTAAQVAQASMQLTILRHGFRLKPEVSRIIDGAQSCDSIC